MKNPKLFFLVIAIISSISCHAAVIFSETFDTDSSSANMASNYSNITFTSGASVVGGVLNLNVNTQFATPNVVPTGAFRVSVDVGANEGAGNYNVALVIGNNNLVFHPGFVPTPGAFRVEGPGGFNNVSMGFVPPINALHHMVVEADGTGQFDISITDANNSNNVFNTSFFNASAVDSAISLRLCCSNTTVTGFFDNFIIENDDIVVPEPSSLCLVLLALFTLRRKLSFKS